MTNLDQRGKIEPKFVVRDDFSSFSVSIVFIGFSFNTKRKEEKKKKKNVQILLTSRTSCTKRLQ